MRSRAQEVNAERCRTREPTGDAQKALGSGLRSQVPHGAVPAVTFTILSGQGPVVRNPAFFLYRHLSTRCEFPSESRLGDRRPVFQPSQAERGGFSLLPHLVILFKF